MERDRRPEVSLESKSPRWWTGLTLLIAVPAVLAIGYSVGRQFFCPADAAQGENVAPATDMPDKYFKGWTKPDLAILLSGQTFGYLQPCGCSRPQNGGLVRRYNMFRLLEKKGWQVAGIDLGEIYPNKAYLSDQVKADGFLPEQAREKFKTTLRILELLNYQDVGIGITEMKMPLLAGLMDWKQLNLRNPRPVSLDLKDPTKILEDKLDVRSFDTFGDKAKVGVSSVVGASVAKTMAGEPNVEFFDTAAMIRTLLPALANKKVDVVILLVHGTEDEAKNIAKLGFAERQKKPALPNIDIIIHTSDFDTPPARPQLVPGTNTSLLFMGHKGKDVGVLGLYRKAAPGGFTLRYDLVTLGPEFDTPANQVAGNAAMTLMEDYAKTVKNADFLSAYSALRISHPTQRDLAKAQVEAKFVGSERCGDCHQKAMKVWEASGHSHAFKTLVDEKNPSLRQFDPECIQCHTVGFKYRTGYFDPPAGATPKQIAKHNEKLLNVGCESCHGPGSMHADDPTKKEFLPLINPIKLANPNGKILLDRFCQSCHDIENDVHWGSRKPFEQSWKKIAHPDKGP
jgi:hypothetical protein